MNVGPQFSQESFHVGLGKEHDIINATQRANQLCPGVFIEDGLPGAFQVAYAGIRVHADNENVAFSPGALEVTNVPHVQRIEAAIGQDDALSPTLVFCKFLTKHIASDDLGSGLTHDSRAGPRDFAADGFKELFARNGRSAALHYDKPACNISDVGRFQR